MSFAAGLIIGVGCMIVLLWPEARIETRPVSGVLTIVDENYLCLETSDGAAAECFGAVGAVEGLIGETVTAWVLDDIPEVSTAPEADIRRAVVVELSQP